MTIWFASGNAHKKAELGAILGGGWNVLIPRDVGLEFDPEETGNSFYENALIKARELHDLLTKCRITVYHDGDPVIADDSGICVDALGGRPGIFSARYAGAQSEALHVAEGTVPDGKKLEACERNALLLAELGDSPNRSARFVCAMALMFSRDVFWVAQETLEGELVKGSEFARGTGGFGYDPILYIPEMNRTVAELSEKEKNKISHRGKAGKIIAAVLRAHSPWQK
jgi:XTP/dITP diphosphohydrolase